MLTYEKINWKNIKSFLSLEITSEQKELMSTSHLQTLWNSFRIGYSELYLIKHENDTVGYVLLYPCPRINKYNVGRLYIDKNHQRKGYGKQALLWAIEKLKEKGAPRILLSVHPDNIVARKLYESVGFNYTELCWGNELVMKYMCTEKNRLEKNNSITTYNLCNR